MEFLSIYINNYLILLLVGGALLILHLELRTRYKGMNGVLLLFCLTLFLASLLDTALTCFGDYHYYLRWTCTLLMYCLRPILIVFLDFFLYPERKRTWLYYLPLIGILLFILTTPLHHEMIYFTRDQFGAFILQKGHLYLTCSCICMVYVLWLLIHAFTSNNEILKTRRFLTVFLVYMNSVSGIISQAVGNDSLMLNTIAVILPLNYLYLYYEQSILQMKEQKDLLHAKSQELTLSQIRPHFLYNTLAAIRYLIRTDPDLAIQTVEYFAGYLRHNLDAAELQYPISAKTEFRNAENFAEIEMIRFSNLDIEFSWQDEDYALPALSVQPLVENAIRHGVADREDGYIRVEAVREDDYHIIRITDNGCGFDTGKTEYHKGVRIVRERLREMVQGELEISSTPGAGTECRIIVPVTSSKKRPDVIAQE